MQEGLTERINELNKIINVKKMDIEECVYEMNNHYYPTIIRVAVSDYIVKTQIELESYNVKLLAAIHDMELTP